MSLEEKKNDECIMCYGNDLSYDDIKGEHVCNDCGYVTVDNVDRTDITQFINNEGMVDRKIGGNELGTSIDESFKWRTDYNGKKITSGNRRQTNRMRKQDNWSKPRTPFRIHVGRRIDSEKMSGSRVLKATAKKIVGQTHDKELHEKRMNDPQMRAAMENANDGEEVKSTLNQTRHSQKTSKDSIRNGDYTVRMVAVASMHVAAKMMGININTKKLAAEFDVDHDHVITESKNIEKYLNIVWEAESNLNSPDWRMPLSPGLLRDRRCWSENDIRNVIDNIRPELEAKYGRLNASKMITRIWAMMEQARSHQFLAGENIRLVAASFTARSIRAVNPKDRLKAQIARWLGIKHTRVKRLERQYSLLMDEIFDANNDVAHS
ncbi:MAG: hypothetical protein CMB72_04945 [Euryarchaeota archaeon]|nr:hypothetical protein [Euryarchaeota archaeon]|tara:strand:- start:7764 stop:8897 length:1134 start_codon:yes stop_codon:yes gene_type:complete